MMDIAAATVHIGDILYDTGQRVTNVTRGPGTFHTTITTEDGETFTVPDHQLVNVQ